MTLFDFPAAPGKRLALWLLAAFFTAAGINHFVNTGWYLAIMPPYLPAHRELVLVSGLFEILGGLGVIPRFSRSFAGWGLVLLIIAVFPANIHMALNPKLYPAFSPWALYLRLPLQLLLIWWAWWCTRPDRAIPGRP